MLNGLGGETETVGGQAKQDPDKQVNALSPETPRSENLQQIVKYQLII